VVNKNGAKERVDTLIVSDVHLGSRLCQADALRHALARFEFKRLILNGDIFDHLNFEPRRSARLGGERSRFWKSRRLEASHLNVLRDIGRIAKEREVIWIEGNHDEGLSTVMHMLTDLRIHKEYEWEYGGRRYIALHGDQFDRFYRENRVLSNIASGIYDLLQSFGPYTKKLCWFLKRSTKHYIRAISYVADGAIAYAQEREAQFIFCGHTHRAEQYLRHGVRYFNSGSWTEEICHLIAIGEQGVNIHIFNSKGEWVGALSPLPEPTTVRPQTLNSKR